MVISEKQTLAAANETKRNKSIRLNTLYVLLLKGLNLGCLYVMVPIQIDYLNTYNYGIWITVFSMLNWFQFLDIGLGNGLRNRYAQCVANNDIKLAKHYVSTTYFLICIISAIILVVFLASGYFVNWCYVFNISKSYTNSIYYLITIVFGSIILSFPLKVITSILNGAQKPALANSFSSIANVLSLVLMIVLLRKGGTNNLLHIGIIYSVVPLALFFVVSIYFLNTEFKAVRPSMAFVKKMYIKDLTGLGMKFFVLQLNSVILFATDAFVIANILGQLKVSEYNVMFRLYSLPYLLFQIIIIPYWSAFTHAYEKGDINWIKQILKKLLYILIGIVGMLILIWLFNGFIFKLWIKNKIHVDSTVGLLFAIYFMLLSAMIPFTNFINGTGKIKLQLYVSCFASLINIPLAIYLTRHFNMGIGGSIVSGIICIVPFVMLMGIQTFKILNNKAEGVWNA